MSSQIEKMKNKNLTVNKTYPPFIEYKNVKIDYEAINPILKSSIMNDLTHLKEINDGTRSSPAIFKNEKTNQYYISYCFRYSKYMDYVFEITDDYDWDKVIENKKWIEEFRIKDVKHIVPIFEDKIYYPGSKEYDMKYPPIN